MFNSFLNVKMLIDKTCNSSLGGKIESSSLTQSHAFTLYVFLCCFFFNFFSLY